jgi:hypothetical protein
MDFQEMMLNDIGGSLNNYAASFAAENNLDDSHDDGGFDNGDDDDLSFMGYNGCSLMHELALLHLYFEA